MNIVKRNGKIEKFNYKKIENAIRKAFLQLGREYDGKVMINIMDNIYEGVGVEDIQDTVVKELMNKHKDVAIAYQSYRTIRNREREDYDLLMGKVNKIYLEGSDDNSNKPSQFRNVKRDLVAGEIEKIQAKNHIPKHIYDAHTRKEIYWHDLDYSGDMPITNCCIPDIWDMLKNSTKINNAEIEDSNSIGVATTVISQIVADIAHKQYGGISISDFNEGLAPYARKNFVKNFKDYYDLMFDDELKLQDSDIHVGNQYLCDNFYKVYSKAKEKTKKDIYDACQTFEYQTNSISSASQTPFSTIMFNIPTSWESKEITKAYFNVRMQGLGKKKKLAIFPKLNYVVVDGYNLKEGDPYFDLTLLASKCISKCFYPDILNYTKEEYENGTIYSRMG